MKVMYCELERGGQMAVTLNFPGWKFEEGQTQSSPSLGINSNGVQNNNEPETRKKRRISWLAE